MRKFLIPFAALVAVSSVAARAEQITVTMHAVDDKGVGPEIGTFKAEERTDGLLLTPSLSGLSPGPHGFHLHEHSDCGPSLKDGKITAANTAGGPFHPHNTGQRARTQ